MGKSRTATEVAELAASLRARGRESLFGENYVQEAQGKQETLAGSGIAWHLIGHLQSNKAEVAAKRFECVQTVDRPKLIGALARHRPVDLPPLDVLLQVNVDDEASKHGCAPEDVEALAAGHAGVDTRSMGMSDDYELAIAEGATMVRLGTALFGPRNK